MSRFQETDVYVIKQHFTNKTIKFGSKCGWISQGAAKNAFNLHMTSYFGKDWSEGKGLFDSQSEFYIEVVS